MTLGTKREDLTLAVMEGVAFAFRDNIEIIKDAGVMISKSKICGGGSKSALWTKIIANVLGIELEIPETEQGPGMGAAMLSMVACGEYASVGEICKKFVRVTGTVKPDREISARYDEKYKKFREIYPACKDLFSKLK
jgi:xylulokinase